MRGSGLFFLLIAAGYLVITLAFSLSTPVWDGPDEHEHFIYIDFFSTKWRLPNHYQDAVKQDHHPPLYHILGALLFSGLRLFDPALAGERGILPQEITLPGPFSVKVPLGAPLVLRGEKVGVGCWMVFSLRLFSVAAGLGVVLFTYLLGREIFPKRKGLVLCGTALCALIPQFNFICGVINNDALAACSSTGALYFLVRAFRRGWGRGIGLPLAAGAFLSAACLVKVSNLFLLLPLLLILFRRPKDLAFWRGWGIVILMTGILCGWWYLLNTFRYGDPFILSGQIATMTERLMGAPITLSYIEAYLVDTFESFWGKFGLMQVSLPQWEFLLYTGLTFASGCGLFLLLWRGGKRKALEREEWWGVLFLALSFLGVLVLVSLGHWTFFSFQGRYLFPALGAIALLLVTGLWQVFGKELGRVHFLIFFLLLFLLNGFAFGTAFLPFYHAPKEKTRGGSVLFYEDPGNERLSPHLERGSVSKKCMVYASTLIPEVNLAYDPERIIFRFGGLEGKRPLLVRFTAFGFDVKARLGNISYQRVLAGPVPLNLALPILPSPEEFCYEIPPEGIEGGGLRLTFEKVVGNYASVSEVWIEEGSAASPALSPVLIMEAEGIPQMMEAKGIPAGRAEKRGNLGAFGVYVLRSLPEKGEGFLFQGFPLEFLPPGRYRMAIRLKVEGGKGEGERGYFSVQKGEGGDCILRRGILTGDLPLPGAYGEVEGTFSLEASGGVLLDLYWREGEIVFVDRISLFKTRGGPPLPR